jgi:proline utilization trans-activator
MLIINRYLSDLQARLAQVEQASENAAGPSRPQTANNDATLRVEERESLEAGDQQQVPHRSSPRRTRENSPGVRHDVEGGNLVNPLVESSKFMSSSSGRTCKCMRWDRHLLN